MFVFLSCLVGFVAGTLLMTPERRKAIWLFTVSYTARSISNLLCVSLGQLNPLCKNLK